MRYVLKMENLDCANCASRMERFISKIPQVESVSVNFLTQKMILVTDEDTFEETLKEINEICRIIHRDTRVLGK